MVEGDLAKRNKKSKPKEKNKVSDFKPDQAVKSIVTVYRTEDPTGMGVLVSDGLILTAAHCLPGIPDRYRPREDAVEVEFKPIGDGSPAKAFVMYADVCADLAVLGDRTLSGLGLPPEYARAFRSAESQLETTPIAIDDLPMDAGFPVHVYTHEGQWLEGVGRVYDPGVPSLSIEISGGVSIQSGTSGSPVFDDQGRIVGVISVSTTDESGDTEAVWVAAALPGWVLRQLPPPLSQSR